MRMNTTEGFLHRFTEVNEFLRAKGWIIVEYQTFDRLVFEVRYKPFSYSTYDRSRGPIRQRLAPGIIGERVHKTEHSCDSMAIRLRRDFHVDVNAVKFSGRLRDRSRVAFSTPRLTKRAERAFLFELRKSHASCDIVGGVPISAVQQESAVSSISVMTNQRRERRCGAMKVLFDARSKCTETVDIHAHANRRVNIRITERSRKVVRISKALTAHDLSGGQGTKHIHARPRIKDCGRGRSYRRASAVDGVCIVAVVTRASVFRCQHKIRVCPTE